MGVVLVGVGIGLMLEGMLGVSPADVFVSGLSRVTGLTVGMVLAVYAAVLVAVTYLFGVRPGLGTFACVVLIGPAIDVTMLGAAAVGVGLWPVWALLLWWVLGLAVFVVGVVGLFAADLGVSPYDQVTQAIAKVTGRSLGMARFLADGPFFVAGVLLGGSWGAGTVVLLLVVPVALNRLLPPARQLVDGPSR